MTIRIKKYTPQQRRSSPPCLCGTSKRVCRIFLGLASAPFQPEFASPSGGWRPGVFSRDLHDSETGWLIIGGWQIGGWQSKYCACTHCFVNIAPVSRTTAPVTPNSFPFVSRELKLLRSHLSHQGKTSRNDTPLYSALNSVSLYSSPKFNRPRLLPSFSKISKISSSVSSYLRQRRGRFGRHRKGRPDRG